MRMKWQLPKIVHLKKRCHASQGDVSGLEASPAVPEDEDEPGYIDDSEDEADEKAKSSLPSKSHLGKTWSFFSPLGFISAQRLQEYESVHDDPTLVARLHRAKLRLEKRRREEQIRLRRVLSVITPLRAAAVSDAVRQCREASYDPRGVE